jgi:hypothetical protein
VFIAHPEFAALLGADATASDGREAVLRANGLLAMLHQEHHRGTTEGS